MVAPFFLQNSNSNETQILQAQRSNICKLNYPTCEAKWDYFNEPQTSETECAEACRSNYPAKHRYNTSRLTKTCFLMIIDINFSTIIITSRKNSRFERKNKYGL